MMGRSSKFVSHQFNVEKRKCHFLILVFKLTTDANSNYGIYAHLTATRHCSHSIQNIQQNTLDDVKKNENKI